MAKFDFKQFMLAKGEKIALGGALAALGLFGVLGLKNAVSADSPSETTNKLKTGAQTVNSKIKNEGTTPPPLPEWVVAEKGGAFTPVDPTVFEVTQANQTFFEPVDFPSTLRENPKVLAITFAQLDLVRAPMKAFDIRDSADGSRQIGVLSHVKVKETDDKAIKAMLKGTNTRHRLGARREAPPPAQQPPAGMGAGASMPGAGGMPGMPGGPGMGGMPGMPGGPGMGGMSGMSGMMGMMGRGGMGGMFGGGMFNQQAERFEQTVVYIPVDEFDKKNPTPAFTVYPLRMVVIHASFPLREQLEEIRRALRLHTVEEARQLSIPGSTSGTSGGLGAPAMPGGPGLPRGGMGGMMEGGMAGLGAASTGSSGGPVFDGFDVERKRIAPNGMAFEWEPYNHEEKYVEDIWSRKVADQPDDGYLSYFLRYDQKMAMPLPALADGLAASYPHVNLPPIIAAVKKMEELRKPKVSPSDQEKKFKGESSGNPFLPQTIGAAGAGGLNGFLGQSSAGPGVGSGMASMMQGMMKGRSQPPPGAMGGMPPGYGGSMPPGYGGSMPPGYGGSMPPGYGGPRGPGGMMYGPAARPESDSPERDHLLIRFFDTDILPGWTYQYRLRVKIKNPNFGRKDVARPDDARKEILTGEWVAIRDRVRVTSELNLYATDPVKYHDTVRDKYKDQAVFRLMDNKDGTVPVVQVQQWMPQVAIESKREPVGTWVIGEMPVYRGEHIGKKQIVPLPMWSAEKGTYILQELPKYKVWKAREQPKGLLVDFSTPFLLVDYDGGKVRPQIGDRAIDDEAATELLILRPDGSVVVHNSAADMEDTDRKDRQQKWDGWIDAVKKMTEQVGLPSMPGAPGGDGFNRGSGGGSPGGSGS